MGRLQGVKSVVEAGDVDLAALAERLRVAMERELYGSLAEAGFTDLRPRHGMVLDHLRPAGVRVADLAQRSGQRKQAISTVVDELVRLGYLCRVTDPVDGRAKLVRPTERGLALSRAADRILAGIEQRHAGRLGRENYDTFKRLLRNVAQHQHQRR
jgi:DNA-binding MarR family transcriptional regulator